MRAWRAVLMYGAPPSCCFSPACACSCPHALVGPSVFPVPGLATGLFITTDAPLALFTARCCSPRPPGRGWLAGRLWACFNLGLMSISLRCSAAPLFYLLITREPPRCSARGWLALGAGFCSCQSDLEAQHSFVT